MVVVARKVVEEKEELVVVARKVVEEKEESGRVSEGASKHE